MARPPYKRVSEFTALWVVLIFGGLMLSVIALMLIYGRRAAPGGVVFGVMIGVALLTFIVSVKTINGLERRRWRRLAEHLDPLGWHVSDTLDAAAKQGLYGAAAHLPEWCGLRLGAVGVRYGGVHKGGAGVYFNHQYITGSGKQSRTHTHTVAAIPAADGPGAGPIVRLYRHGRFEAWHVRRRGEQDFEIGDAQFDKDWRITGDEAAARHLVTPSLRQMLADAPKGEQWVIGGGWVALVTPGSLDGTGSAAFLDRLSRVALRLSKP